MPKFPLTLKATVSRRQAEPVPPDMAERLKQLKHHQRVANAAMSSNEAATALEPEPSDTDLKQNAHALQIGFLMVN